jgi:hypothetical protein
LQIRVALICGLIQMCDGYDVGSIGWSVPSLTHAWHRCVVGFRAGLSVVEHTAMIASRYAGFGVSSMDGRFQATCDLTAERGGLAGARDE